MCKVITMGEPLVVFVAEEQGNLKNVSTFSKGLAGAELNVSIGLSRLGHSVRYIGKIGPDPFGEYIYESLLEEGVDLSCLWTDNRLLTGFYLKSKAAQGDPDIFYYRKNSAASGLNAEDIVNMDLSNVKILHVTGIGLAISESFLSAQRALIKKAKEKNVRIFFDPNIRPALWEDKVAMVRIMNDVAAASDYVLPGIEEGKLLTGSDNPEKIAEYYLSSGVKAVMVKLGEKGAFVQTQEEKFHMEGFKVDHIVDTVGAGDGFATGVISGLLEGLSLKEAVRRGNAIGAFAIMSKGDNAGMPRRDALDKFMQR